MTTLTGGLSRSYILDVFYKIGDDMTHEHWFVKIPKSLQTVAMDERELTMYNTIFPRLQKYLSETLDEEVEVDLPIPIIYFSSFVGDNVHDCLVTENLCANRYFQVGLIILADYYESPDSIVCRIILTLS